MIPESIKELSLEYLKKSPVGEELQEMASKFEKIQQAMYNVCDTNNDKTLMTIRCGTVLTFAVINQLSAGKNPKDFSNEDWEYIANAVIDYGINCEDEEYSIIVFLTYADYIEVSAEVIKKYVPEEVVSKITDISIEIREKTEALKNKDISEVSYIDECLWLSLEGMIKLLSAYSAKYIGPQLHQFVDGVSSYAFEYGRLILYKRENELLQYYLECQDELDEELSKKYEAYIDELTKSSERVNSLIDNAFSDDIRKNLRGSIDLAKEVGVEDSEILDSVEKIDDYFM